MLSGQIRAVKEILFCRDEALAFCQIQIRYLARSLQFCLWALVSFHGAPHLTQGMFARQENIVRWKVVLSSTFQVCFLGLSRLCRTRFPRNTPSSAVRESQPSKITSKLLSVSAHQNRNMRKLPFWQKKKFKNILFLKRFLLHFKAGSVPEKMGGFFLINSMTNVVKIPLKTSLSISF